MPAAWQSFVLSEFAFVREDEGDGNLTLAERSWTLLLALTRLLILPDLTLTRLSPTLRREQCC